MQLFIVKGVGYKNYYEFYAVSINQIKQKRLWICFFEKVNCLTGFICRYVIFFLKTNLKVPKLLELKNTSDSFQGK